MLKTKSLFLIIFGIIFFMFGFGGNKQDIQTAEAVGCRASCNKGASFTFCSPGCYYTDAHADSAGNFGACSVGSALTKCNPIVKYDSDCSSASMSCKEENCGGLVAANGTACVVTLGIAGTWGACSESIKNGTWYNGKCVECPSGTVWGDSSQIYYAGNPTDLAACGAVCTPSTPTISNISPASYSGPATTQTFNFKITRGDANCGASAVVPLRINCSGGTPNWTVGSTVALAPGASDNSRSVNVAITATGYCDITAESPSDSSKTSTQRFNYTVTACPPGFAASFNGSGYSVGDQLFINYTIPVGKNGCVAIYTPSGNEDWNRDDGPGPHFKVGGGFATSAGLWKVTISDGIGSCSSTSTCFATTNVAGATGCTVGTCGGTGNQWCNNAGTWEDCTGGRVCLPTTGICGFPGAIQISNCNSCDPAPLGVCEDRKASGLTWTVAPDCATDADIGQICSSDAAACQIELTDGTTCSCAGGGGGGDDDAGVVTSACDNKIWFFCNPLRGTIDDIFQAGETLIGYILGLIGSIALLLIIIAGVMYMTSMGNEEKITNSKKIITGAVIGLAIALLSYSLLQLVISIL